MARSWFEGFEYVGPARPRGVPVLTDAGEILGWFLVGDSMPLEPGTMYYFAVDKVPLSFFARVLTLYVEVHRAPPARGMLSVELEDNLLAGVVLDEPEELRLCFRARGGEVGMLGFCSSFVPAGRSSVQM